MREDGVVLETRLSDRAGEATFTIVSIAELGVPGPQFDKDQFMRKVAELFLKTAQFDVLFSDYALDDPELFAKMVLNPQGVFLEFMREEEPVGVAYITDLLPHWDASVHISFWDKEPRIELARQLAWWAIRRYDLPRLTAEIPVYQSGTIRFAERIGFKREGVRRVGALYKGRRFDTVLLGLLPEDLEEASNGRRNTQRNTA